MGPRLLVLGEGKSEEGEGYFDPGLPGTPIPDEYLGAAHVIVRRILVELLGREAPTFVFPPRLRPARRTGNAGLIADLRGRQRVAGSHITRVSSSYASGRTEWTWPSSSRIAANANARPKSGGVNFSPLSKIGVHLEG
jgi:hypothetical protein